MTLAHKQPKLTNVVDLSFIGNGYDYDDLDDKTFNSCFKKEKKKTDVKKNNIHNELNDAGGVAASNHMITIVEAYKQAKETLRHIGFRVDGVLRLKSIRSL